MLSTMTVNELAEKVLEPKVCKAVDRVEVDVQTSSTTGSAAIPTKSVDELAREHLSVELVQALSKIEMKGNEFGLIFDIQQVRLSFHGRGILILLLILWVASRITDVNPLLHLLQALVNSP